MRPPFLIKLVHDCPAGILDLQLVFRDAVLADHKTGWQDVLRTFINAANCGALSGAAIAPADSGCVLEREAFSEHEAFWRLRRTLLDPGALTVLINLCHWGHLNVSKVEQLVLCWERCPTEANAKRIAFPKAWPRLSFTLKEYELVGQTIGIDIEFADPQPAGKREQINDSIGHWFKTANWGGYADDRFPLPASTVIVAPEPMTTDPLGITWYIEAFHCSDKVLDGLMNCLDRINVTQAQIRQVTLGE